METIRPVVEMNVVRNCVIDVIMEWWYCLIDDGKMLITDDDDKIIRL